MLTRDHIVLPASHTFIHKWNEPYLPLLPTRRATAHFGRYSFSVPLGVEGWVGLSGLFGTVTNGLYACPCTPCILYQVFNSPVITVYSTNHHIARLHVSPAGKMTHLCCQVFLPSDDAFTWILAKMWFNNADANVQQALCHFGNIFLPAS